MIAAAQSFVDITITPVLDSVAEGAETVFLTLGDTGSYDVGSPVSATITIADAPAAPVPALPAPAVALLLLGLAIPGWRNLSRRPAVCALSAGRLFGAAERAVQAWGE
jgi:hypothetical protein